MPHFFFSLWFYLPVYLGFPGGSTVKNPPAMQEMGIQSLGEEDPLEEGMQPTAVFLPGESHGQRSLVGRGPWRHRVVHD